MTDLAAACPGGAVRISGSQEVIRAEVIHAVREEMALHLPDILLRRTDLGTLGDPGDDAIRECATILATELNWTPDRTEREIRDARAIYRLAP
jgi:glycerol-3-phosphate dehydrogenase